PPRLLWVTGVQTCALPIFTLSGPGPLSLLRRQVNEVA
ncbi:hypothetical protein, partial [Escherichia coli]